MSSASPCTVFAVAPFEIHTVHFDFPGGQAIKLKDPVTDLMVGVSPEWVAGVRNELAAYVRSTRPALRVAFHGTPAVDGTYTVGADGVPFQVQEQQVTLAFDAVTGLSNVVTVLASADLPDQIGLHRAKLDSYLRAQFGSRATCFCGSVEPPARDKLASIHGSACRRGLPASLGVHVTDRVDVLVGGGAE